MMISAVIAVLINKTVELEFSAGGALGDE